MKGKTGCFLAVRVHRIRFGLPKCDFSKSPQPQFHALRVFRGKQKSAIAHHFTPFINSSTLNTITAPPNDTTAKYAPSGEYTTFVKNPATGRAIPTTFPPRFPQQRHLKIPPRHPSARNFSPAIIAHSITYAPPSRSLCAQKWSLLLVYEQ